MHLKCTFCIHMILRVSEFVTASHYKCSVVTCIWSPSITNCDCITWDGYEYRVYIGPKQERYILWELLTHRHGNNRKSYNTEHPNFYIRNLCAWLHNDQTKSILCSWSADIYPCYRCPMRTKWYTNLCLEGKVFSWGVSGERWESG